MPQKRKTRRSKKNTPAPKHVVADGFWRQVGAVLLIVVALLLIVSWFSASGPVMNWIDKILLSFIGYAVYATPVLLVYLAIAIFRAKNNRVSLIVKIALFSEVVWFAALFDLLKNDNGMRLGGSLGRLVGNGMLMLMNPGIAALIYVLLIVITLMFILNITPASVFRTVADLFSYDRGEEVEGDADDEEDADSEDTSNKKKSKHGRLFGKPGSKAEHATSFQLTAGVPTIDPKTNMAQKARSTMRNSVERDKTAESSSALVTISDPNWKAPGLDLLEKKQSPADAGDVKQNAEIISDTLREFNIDVEMEGANIGPKVTQYTLKPPSGVKLARITALETNIALNLAARSLRIEAPIPGKRAVGIEVPNLKAADVRLYAVLKSQQWRVATDPLTFAIGQDVSGQPVVANLAKMPHLLIAGQTGSGKSVMINSMLVSLLYRNSPSNLKLILVDPKRVEMEPYQDIPHLLTPVINDPDKAISALKWAVNEMERRYTLLAEKEIRDIKTYNQMVGKGSVKIEVADEDGIPQRHREGAMPYIVIVIDELSDLMMVAARDVEALIVRLTQKARAVGIHLVLATQRPSVNVITGLIKANVPARIAFTVASQVDSRTIIDHSGAEKLLGQGDMLFSMPSFSKPKRAQGALVTDNEVKKVAAYLKLQSPSQYNAEVISQSVHLNGRGAVVIGEDSDTDALFDEAVSVVIASKKASTSLLQRRLKIGYGRASRIIEDMESKGIIGPQEGSKARPVLISDPSEIGQDTDESDQDAPDK